MATGREPSEEAVSAQDVEAAERRVAEARGRAAYAGLSAARSIEESARQHERLASVQDVSVDRGVSHTDVHRTSADRHREAAAEDRKMAEAKRKESEADLAIGPNPRAPRGR